MAGSVRESAMRDWLGDVVWGADGDAAVKRIPATVAQQSTTAMEVRPGMMIIARL
jgi:hypothetical protein